MDVNFEMAGGKPRDSDERTVGKEGVLYTIHIELEILDMKWCYSITYQNELLERSKIATQTRTIEQSTW